MNLNKDEKKMFFQSVGFSISFYIIGLAVIIYENGFLVREFVRAVS